MNAPVAPTERRALHPFATAVRRTGDWGTTAHTGHRFVVAGTKGDWIAIRFGGSKV
ncbi:MULTISPECIES: hypothetical protein [Streptomyces]|uniref:Uncharacterized protein n=1 Tax=Streptomyces canarius TaxID=285453 RepID=A0ABQ3D4Q3_9ACTN|nr:hypothetical protein [Streptomyces canarius]GHA54527.1 hypothetical protein GCM10010345_68960 [Streptomyces canarius]